MQGEPHISAHEIGPPFSSSGDAMIHRLCTDHFSCTGFSDKLAVSKTEQSAAADGYPAYSKLERHGWWRW